MSEGNSNNFLLFDDFAVDIDDNETDDEEYEYDEDDDQGFGVVIQILMDGRTVFPLLLSAPSGYHDHYDDDDDDDDDNDNADDE